MTMVDMEPIEAPNNRGIVHDVATSMHPEIRDLWVAGLQSNMYQEGRTQLRTKDDRYDALGVLADIAVQLDVAKWDHNEDEDRYHIFGFYNGLPNRIREWAGFKGMHPSHDVPLTWDGERHPIWRLTDTFRLGHDVIGDLIAAQY